MNTIYLPNSFFVSSRKFLTDRLDTKSVFLIFSPDEYHRNGDQYFPFRQNSDLYHLCGINQEETILMLNHIDNEWNEMLFIKHIDNTQRIWHGEKLEKKDAGEISGIQKVEWNTSFEEILLQNLEFIDTIYYVETPNLISFDNCPTSNMRRIDTMKKEFPEKKFVAVNDILAESRLIKKPEELKVIRQAVAITKDAYEGILKNTRPNKYEYEIEADIIYHFIRRGAAGHAYSPIVASGINACILHYVDNDKIMKDNDLLLLDFGAEYGNYAADCSRTIPINGKFSTRQRDCYNAVLRVYNKAHNLYIPGNTIDFINEKVGQWMQEEMIQLGLFTQKEVDENKAEEPLYKRYFMHGTAHFIGLDVHDVGTKQTPFKEGMLLSCEPGLYIEEEGIGIRIETDILVGKTPIDLMADFAVSVDEIEKAMQSHDIAN